ncbi:type VII secretion integral membrane protein EccD [Actinoplanes derwentensis]|uniref:Type VII secretion integral membrane protein EccD n=1 Tax=Actinoplanes derwentensis TaxID=113562 RepID=A0A1H1XLC0_9ACTN|nr:type VII secretion integral membrane protein EccD [Actinoplanes derwentensis]GID87745.1 hypothetical protein Ade03nite_66690 [Actinoplanes derwentensis]SDT10020.1 type VII secretion integral membrane protein EccD [Actinoplanes derwentensis]
MSTATQGQLCRITVVGPDRRADLAVPHTVTVAALLPVLLRHIAATDSTPPGGDEGAWVLQRLGEEPFDLAGTPESLDWLEGEELHLRPAQDPLPELDFDDVAEGIATVVNRRGDRWQPEYRRPLFVILAAVLMVLVAMVLTGRGALTGQVAAAAVIAVALGAAALISARKVPDGVFSLLFGLGSAGYTGLAAARVVTVPDGPAVTWSTALAFAVGVFVLTDLLLLAQRTVTPYLPVAPTMVAALTAGVTVLLLLAQSASGMTPPQSAALGIALFVVVVVVAPRVAVKLARLRGPQLPKTGADMTYDIEPAAFDTVRDRTHEADTYLTVVMVTGALVLPVLFHYTLGDPGWAGWLYVLLVAAALLLRARAFFGLWQRVALTVAGTAGIVLVVRRLTELLPAAGWWVLLTTLLVLLVPLVMAAMRPGARRMLPFWEYTATFFDVATGVVALPVLVQILGLYAWARGLFG